MLKPHPAYGLDLPKNITEVYGTNGGIKTAYTYTPYGQVTASGSTVQPIQWSSEHADTDLALVYYNYRHYNPTDGRWTGRDLARISEDQSLYCYIQNAPVANYDISGLIIDAVWDIGNVIWDVGTVIYGASTGNDNKVQEGITDLAADALAALIPGVPAGASKAARAAAKRSAKELAKKRAECLAIWEGYKSLNCKACKGRCMSCASVRSSIACFSALAAGRLLYLKKRCDHYLEGSISRGSREAELGHRKAQRDALTALNKCKAKLATYN